MPSRSQSRRNTTLLAALLGPAAPIATAFVSLAFESSDDIDPVYLAVQHLERSKSDLGRDRSRKPRQILAFFTIKESMRVADIQAGNGDYTELISLVIGAKGAVYCVNDAVIQCLYGKPLTERLEREGLDSTNVVCVDEEIDDMGLPQDLDRLLLSRFRLDGGRPRRLQ